LTLGLAAHVERLITALPFEYAAWNFYRAAQQGMDAELLWPGDAPPNPRPISARKLLLELLPTAEAGLSGAGVDSDEISRMLSVIRDRIAARTTPALWQRRRTAALERRASRREALHGTLEAYLSELSTGRAVHEWNAQP